MARGVRWRPWSRCDHKTGSNAALRSRANGKSTEVLLDFCLSLPHPRGMAKDTKVIAANAAFYHAFSTGDFDEMERMWATMTPFPAFIPAGRPSSAGPR